MAIKDIAKDIYKKWKNSSSTRGFNNYEIIPKSDNNIIGTMDTNESTDIEKNIVFERQEKMRTINLNESTSTILKNWTMRPNLSESINEDLSHPI
tara:strand:+ start:335 stop:619 length:285 start_codon:yes stop_codon:yes gene_type:complete